MKLGALIKYTRIEKGLSQSAFARAICLSSGAVSMIEHSKSYPGHENLKKICEVLSVEFEKAMELLLFEKYGIKKGGEEKEFER